MYVIILRMSLERDECPWSTLWPLLTADFHMSDLGISAKLRGIDRASWILTTCSHICPCLWSIQDCKETIWINVYCLWYYLDLPSILMPRRIRETNWTKHQNHSSSQGPSHKSIWFSWPNNKNDRNKTTNQCIYIYIKKYTCIYVLIIFNIYIAIYSLSINHLQDFRFTTLHPTHLHGHGARCCGTMHPKPRAVDARFTEFFQALVEMQRFAKRKGINWRKSLKVGKIYTYTMYI